MQLIECAHKAGVTPDTLRHYLRIGLLVAEGRSANGYRTFSERSVARVRFVRDALSLGFTLRDVSELIEMSSRGELPCPRARQLLDEHLGEQGLRLQAANRLHRRMRQAASDWRHRPDGVPDGHSICGLIEGAARATETPMAGQRAGSQVGR